MEPIISEDLWDQCNAILDEQEKKNKRPARKAVHLFTGFAFCNCGNKMYVPSNSPKYICYQCRNKIPDSDLEEIFHQQLKTFFFSSVEISNYLNNADRIIKEKEELLRALEEERQKVEKEAQKVYRSYIDDELTVKEYGRLYRPLVERRDQIENQIPEIQGEIDFLKIQYLSSDQILNEAKDLYSRWPDLNPADKRKIIENITDRIIVGTDDITINLCYLPTSPKTMTTGQRNFRDSLQPPA
jgi:site-specific DNA recombinase